MSRKMKKILFPIIAATLTFSCQGPGNPGSVEEVIREGDLKKILQKRDQVRASHDSIGKVLAKLEEAIAQKDTTLQYPLVTTFGISDTGFNSYISIQGNVKTTENVLVYPEHQGVITRMYVRQGQHVNQGQTLAKIDDGGLSDQLAQLETRYKLARTTFERQKRLWKQNIGTEIRYLQAESEMEAAEAAVKQQRSQIAKTTVKAPFTGVVDEIITEQGQVVAPVGAAILRLVNPHNMYIEADVPENYLGSISQGTKVGVKFPALGITTEGTVRSVGSYIDPGNRTFKIQVNIPGSEHRIKPNLMASLQINSYSNTNALVVPASAIQENAVGEKYVFVINPDEGKTSSSGNQTAKVVRIQIEAGHKSNGFVEVLGGLNGGDTIVWEGALALRDGASVSIMEDKK